MTENTAAAAQERLSGYHRDRIRRAAKAAGVVNVTYKSKAENVAAMVAANVVDITDSDEPVFNFAVVEDAAQAARDERDARDNADMLRDQILAAARQEDQRVREQQNERLAGLMGLLVSDWEDDDEARAEDLDLAELQRRVRERLIEDGDLPEESDDASDEWTWMDERQADAQFAADNLGPDDLDDYPEPPSFYEEPPESHVPEVFHLVTIASDGSSQITVTVDGELHVVQDSHPLYKRLTTALLAGDDPTPFLADDIEAALNWLQSSVSDRVTVEHARDDAGKAHAKVLVDGEEVHGKVVEQFKRYFLEGREPANLISFLERVKENPLPVAEVGLYNWDSALTIDADGYFIGFKSVYPVRDEATGEVVAYQPSHRGPGEVNGITPEDEYLRFNVGDVVTIDRDLVRPGPECSVGLHVGTYRYAQNFLRSGVVMEVKVDPADIVNVPYGESGKLRCCRFEVLGFHDANGVLAHHEPPASYEDRTDEIVESIEAEDPEAAGFFRRLFGRGRKG